MNDEAPRSSALKVARQRRMHEWFGKRRWRVCTELSYEHEAIVVRDGEFWIKGGDKVFRTPFGNKGTHGYILQEVDPVTGQDVWTVREGTQVKQERSRASFGWVVLKRASEMFPGSIVKLPPRPYGQRGGVASGLEKNRKEGQ
jgi:hypothetical protein